MARSLYLTPADYAGYGVPAATMGQVQQASDLIDTALARPDGCVWVPDAFGNPCYMAGRAPMMTYRAQSAISPGTNVIVPLPGLMTDDTLMGEVLILDAANPNFVEACIVKAYAPGQITLATVLNSHAAPCTMDRGMVITEESSLPSNRSITRLSQWPIVRLHSGAGRYSYGRRSDQIRGGWVDDINMLSIGASFGGAPIWELYNCTETSLNPRTGEFWVPSGLLISYFTETKIRYVGGWPAAALPHAIKTAAASIIRSLGSSPAGPSVRKFTAGKVSVERFTDQVIDDDTRNLLRPYRATVLG